MKKTHLSVTLPAGLKREIDSLVGPRRRSAFMREAAQQEIERRRLLASLRRGPASIQSKFEIRSNAAADI